MKLRDLTLDFVIGHPADALATLFASAQRNFRAELVFYAALLLTLTIVLVTDRARLARYRQPNVRTDMLYAIVELTHIESILIVGPVVVLASGWIRAMFGPDLALWGDLPWWYTIPLLVLVFDFTGYWVHRAKHANIWLWQFHKIHHSQTELTAFSRFRFPWADRLLDALILLPLSILLGSPVFPVAYYFLVSVRSCLDHSGMNWTYGWLGNYIVSPRYHGLHHSIAPEHLDRNFANALPIWDRLFGTRGHDDGAPFTHGLIEEQIPQSYLYGLVGPFIGISRELRRRWRRTA